MIISSNGPEDDGDFIPKGLTAPPTGNTPASEPARPAKLSEQPKPSSNAQSAPVEVEMTGKKSKVDSESHGKCCCPCCTVM
ncbi:hypothetical protein BD311DRAFT_745889 [Dichomitus squalens]|uniref:Uncharacterized protein n=1 Tax=Dichomitus squalens TaxID=114155 RepID=A0A4Q9N7F8_9APHY|nr:hypothetical protein BD311DRAFT_745889 [Dichomitus squalens]